MHCLNETAEFVESHCCLTLKPPKLKRFYCRVFGSLMKHLLKKEKKKEKKKKEKMESEIFIREAKYRGRTTRFRHSAEVIFVSFVFLMNFERNH